ncbi:MAG: chalcone isomerase [Fluviicola sp.]|nr:MAG: chalcone isomerase [Fluviicola sp.]
MKLKLLFITLLSSSLMFNAKAQDIEVAGAKFPAKMKISDKVVVYNGAGLREKYFFDLYVSALYLPEKTSDAKEVINMDKESCIRIKLVSDKVTRDKFVETVKEGFGTSTEGKATESEIKEFMGFFNTEFKTGDDIILIYKPGTGVEVYMNGKKLGTSKGLEFKKALWGIWFGDKPADAGLKKAMLGKV